MRRRRFNEEQTKPVAVAPVSLAELGWKEAPEPPLRRARFFEAFGLLVPGNFEQVVPRS